MKSNPEPKKKSVTPNSAGDVLRERLQRLKARGNVSDVSGARSTTSANTHSKLPNTSLRTKSQKTRKGLRPG